MPGRAKPGTDWTAIEECWRAGQSNRSLARRFGVTHQAIGWRAKHHGWTRSPEAEAIAATETMERIERPKTARDRALSALDARRTPAAMQKILDALRRGSTKRLAARQAGISDDALHEWLAADGEFCRLADMATAEFAATTLERVTKAGERGEWRADLAMLERHPATRADFAPQPELDTPANISVSVLLPPELAAILDAARPAPKVIEGKADEE